MNKNNVVCFGEIMMRLNTPHHQRFLQSENLEIFYGGSEANVSVLLAQLGTRASYVSRLPLNDLGQSALNAVHKFGVDTSMVVRGPERLGLYFTETSNSLRPSKVIYDRKDSAFASLQPGMINWEHVFQDAAWFHWSGISPAVSSSVAAVCLEALKVARKMKLRISADLNYRSMLWAWGKHPSEIMPELLSYCDVITGDIDTAEIYFGITPDRTLSRNDALHACGQSLFSKLPDMKQLAMSFREMNDNGSQRYSGVLMSGGQLLSSAVHEFGNIVERIGSGDAFMAGLIHGMVTGMTGQLTLDFAVAAGALKHSIPGEFTLLTQSEIDNFLLHGNAKGRIIR